jgi:hypothetical protein
MNLLNIVFGIIGLLIIMGIIYGVYKFRSTLKDTFNKLGIKVGEYDLGQKCGGLINVECKYPYACDYSNYNKKGGYQKTGDKVCVEKVKDWAGIYFVPSECRSAPAPLGKEGDCHLGYSWPRLENQPCDTNLACKGHSPGRPSLGCNNGKCQKMVKDWIGVFYNKSECVGKCTETS